MDIGTLLQIVEATLSLLKGHLGGSAGTGVDTALELEKLIRAGNQAYLDQVGKPLDPDLIKPA